MKIYVALTLLMTIGSSMALILGNGQPGCKTDVEMAVVYYRNLWDPTSYWKCETQNTPASSVKCPDMTAFDDATKDCVDWELWSWQDPIDPPSKP